MTGVETSVAATIAAPQGGADPPDTPAKMSAIPAGRVTLELSRGTTRGHKKVFREAKNVKIAGVAKPVGKGIMLELNISANRVVLSRKRYSAKANPASEQKKSTPSALSVVTITLLPYQLQKGQPLNSRVKLPAQGLGRVARAAMSSHVQQFEKNMEQALRVMYTFF